MSDNENTAPEQTVNHSDSPDQAQEETAQHGKRAFTIKSILFGVFALLFTIAITDYNDFLLKQTSFVSNHLPPGPIFLVLSLACIWNPAWRNRWILLGLGFILTLTVSLYCAITLEGSFWGLHTLLMLPFVVGSIGPIWNVIHQKMLMNSRELMVALLILFAGCWTAGAGLNRFFTYMQIVPWTQYSNSVSMQKYQTIEYVPEHLWPAGGLSKIGDDNLEKKRVYDAFTTGYAEQQTDNIPWDAWMPPLLGSWLPLLALFSICLIAISLIVHRQWAHHEQLSYPIAQIGASLFDRKGNRWLPDIFYSKLFWIAAGMVIFYHLIRLLHSWWPNSYPDVPNGTSFSFIWSVFPIMSKSG